MAIIEAEPTVPQKRLVPMSGLTVCTECVRLHERHSQAMLEHVRLRAQLRETPRRKRGAVSGLVLAEVTAQRNRDEAELVLRRHAVAHEQTA